MSRTLDRSKLWDVQTPQILRPQMLRDGFANANANQLAVTDDVSVHSRETAERQPRYIRDTFEIHSSNTILCCLILSRWSS